MTAVNMMKTSQPSRFINSNFTDDKTGNTEENMLKFPNMKNILWDHTKIGSESQISISYFRKPRLCISEKVLRFAHRHVESKGQTVCGCALVGQLSVDDDGEGLKFTLDRFDPGGDSLNNSYSLSPGDLAVPFQVMLNSKNERQSSSDDYLQALQLLKQRCNSKNSIDLSNFLLTKGWCNIYTSGDKCVHHLEFDVVTLATEFKATPITPVPIVPTALSKNLSGPMSMSHLQGEPKTGYLTMDHTRKVLLVLESDPKVATLPIVGIWVSGVSFVYSPYIWSCCLRYLHNSSLNDRVCVPPESFLLVLYNPMHSKPEFYEIVTSNGNCQMNFDLFNGYEVVNLPKMMTASQRSIEMDISSVEGGQKKERFDGAIHLLKSQRSNRNEDVPVSTPVSTPDEMTPRNMPAPHKSQLPAMTSMVPDVSLLFGEDSGICVNPRKSAITQGKPFGVAHTSDFRPMLPVLNEQPIAQQIKSAPVSSAHQVQQYLQTNNSNCVQSDRVAQHYINSVPKSGLTSDSYMQNKSSSQDQNRTVNSNPMFQNRTSQQDFTLQNRQNSNFALPNNSSSQNCNNNNMTSNGPVRSGQRFLPQTMPGYPQHLAQPYPQYVTANHVPYFQGQPPPQYTGGPLPYSQGSTGQPQYPPQQYTTQGHPLQQANYSQVPANQQQYVPNQQGFIQTSTNQQGLVQTSSNQQGIIQTSNVQFMPITAQTRQTQAGNTEQRQQDQRPSPHADSSKSSDDSGLSVTPEKQALPPKAGNKNEEEQPSSVLQSKNINWNQVPPEVYQLLVQQDAQLKKLQSQIEMLLNNQSTSSQSTTTTELDSETSSVKKTQTEMCSVAVNTSMLYPKPQNQSVSLQTSPQRSATSRESTPCQSSQCSGEDVRTPAEIRHRGILPFNSTQKDDFDLDASQDLSGVVNNMALHDKTIDSIQSDMIVDMPSYHSSPTRSERSGDTLSNSQETFSNSVEKSPTSASMCGQQDDSGDEHETVDDKDYYERLMNNIQLLLNQQSTTGETTLQNDTLQQSIMLGQYINSIQQRSGNSSRNQLETTFIPKINYMSMMFDSDSDSSMEINAMAMKYLKDEQLTQMTKLQTRAKLSGNNGQQRVAMLRHILSDDKEATPDVTTVGMSPNDMTFATRKYMEKHGLINSRNTTADSSENDSYQLKLDYSTSSCRSESPIQISSDSHKTPVRQNVSSRLNSPFGNSHNTPVRGSYPPMNRQNKTVSPKINSQPNSPLVNSHPQSPFVNSQTKSPFVNSRTKGPFINSQPTTPATVSDRGGRNYHFTASPEVQPSTQPQTERHEVVTEHRQFFEDDDDKILDITRLRMLPKLL